MNRKLFTNEELVSWVRQILYNATKPIPTAQLVDEVLRQNKQLTEIPVYNSANTYQVGDSFFHAGAASGFLWNRYCPGSPTKCRHCLASSITTHELKQK